MIKIYGTSQSRTSRCLWALEELGLKYEHNPVPVPNTHSPEHLKLNPNGHIPAMDDEGLIVWESMAINLYLAEKYGQGKLWPANANGHAHAYQWSFFAITELEPHILNAMRNLLFAPPDQRDEKAGKKSLEDAKAPLKIVDNALAGREYLVDNKFSVADINLGSLVAWGTFVKMDLSFAPNVAGWLQRCTGREAYTKLRSLK